MKDRLFASLAFFVLAAVALPATSFAAQNTGGNWPSRSCGCSSVGKCYIANRSSGESQCLPDSSGGNACTGVCSFTTHNPSAGGGFIMRYGLGFQGGQGTLSTAP
jgi:hypothetical protein